MNITKDNFREHDPGIIASIILANKDIIVGWSSQLLIALGKHIISGIGKRKTKRLEILEAKMIIQEKINEDQQRAIENLTAKIRKYEST